MKLASHLREMQRLNIIGGCVPALLVLLHGVQFFFTFLTSAFPWRDSRKPRIISVKISGRRAGVRTWDFANREQEFFLPNATTHLSYKFYMYVAEGETGKFASVGILPRNRGGKWRLDSVSSTPVGDRVSGLCVVVGVGLRLVMDWPTVCV